MSLEDYRVATRLDAEGIPFLALLMAAVKRSDPTNSARLSRAFPEVEDELRRREKQPDGRLPSEREWDAFEVPR